MGRFITEQDRQNLGDDTIDAVARVSYETLSPALQQLANENARLDNANRQLQQRVSRSTVLAALDAAFGSREAWETINRSDAFKAWLAHSHPLSGQVKHTHLLSAFEMGSADRVIAIFRQYIAEGSAVSQHTRPQTNRSAAGRFAAGQVTPKMIEGLYERIRKQGRTPALDAEEKAMHAALHQQRR